MQTCLCMFPSGLVVGVAQQCRSVEWIQGCGCVCMAVLSVLMYCCVWLENLDRIRLYGICTMCRVIRTTCVAELKCAATSAFLSSAHRVHHQPHPPPSTATTLATVHRFQGFLFGSPCRGRHSAATRHSRGRTMGHPRPLNGWVLKSQRRWLHGEPPHRRHLQPTTSHVQRLGQQEVPQDDAGTPSLCHTAAHAARRRAAAAAHGPATSRYRTGRDL